jgi:hypothetical protein
MLTFCLGIWCSVAEEVPFSEMEDLLGSEIGKNDYDWCVHTRLLPLLSPPLVGRSRFFPHHLFTVLNEEGVQMQYTGCIPPWIGPNRPPFPMDHFSELVELDRVNEQVGLGWSVTGTDLNQPLF